MDEQARDEFRDRPALRTKRWFTLWNGSRGDLRRGTDLTIICGHYGFGTSIGDRVRGGSVDSCGSISITKDPEETTMSETKFVIVTSGLLMLSSSTSFGR